MSIVLHELFYQGSMAGLGELCTRAGATSGRRLVEAGETRYLYLAPPSSWQFWPYKLAVQVEGQGPGSRLRVRLLAWDIGVWKKKALLAALMSYEKDIGIDMSAGSALWQELSESEKIGEDVPWFVASTRVMGILPWALLVLFFVLTRLWSDVFVLVGIWVIWLSVLSVDLIPRLSLRFGSKAGLLSPAAFGTLVAAVVTVTWLLT